MRIPRFWQKAEQEFDAPGGERWQLAAWGWSDADDDAAAEHARQRLRAQAEAISAGRPTERYGYAERPLREEILETPFAGALITRNGYGVHVLNSDEVAFVDVDLDVDLDSLPSNPPGFFARLFGHTRTRQSALDETLELLATALRAKRGASCRVYETRAGLRLILTDQLYSPTAAETLELFEGLGCDPLYMKLCRLQECFRARLTPKPWRCDMLPSPYRWPHADAARRDAAQAWVVQYEAAAAGYATTRYVTTLGSRTVDAAVRPTVDVHDRLSGAESGLPLA